MVDVLGGSGKGSAFGFVLRQHRESAGLTQEELAERAGLTPRAISALERGERRRPYPHTVRVLAEALGLSVEQRDALVASIRLPDAVAPGAPAARPVLPLPLPPTPIVGRERELADLVATVCDQAVRLATLIGPGGVGKTRLAIKVARRAADAFPDGIVFAPLAALANADLVLPTVGHALGVSGVGRDGLLAALHALLRGRRLLLVLDNFEHLVSAAPEVAELIAVAPGLTVLATSRAALRLRGEREYPVAPLAVPPLDRSLTLADVAADPAVELFVARARSAVATFALTPENVGAVAAICRRVDGLPLAIELVAAWVRLLPPAALLAKLDRSSLPLLTGGPRDLPARQQTMEAAVAWSYDLLDHDEAALFRRLSVFAGGFTLDAAEWVVEGTLPSSTPSGPSALVLVASLADKSLVAQTPGPEGDLRFAMLDTIREFGLRLLGNREARLSRRRHAEWFLARAEEAESGLLGARQETWYDRLEPDLANLRAAFDWFVESEDRPSAVRLAGALWPFWFVRGNPTEGRGWLDRAVAWADDGSEPARLKALSGAGLLAMAQQDFARADALLEPARDLAVATGEEAAAGRALFGLGVVAQDTDDPATAEERFAAALTAFEAAGDELWAAITLGNLGLVVARRGNLERGAELLERGLRRHRDLKFGPGEALALRFLGQVTRQRGDDGRAAELFRRSLANWRREQGWHVAGALEGLAGIAADHGQPECAVRLFAACSGLREAIGVPVEPALRPAHEQTLNRLGEALGEESFARHWTIGMTAGIAGAVAEAAMVGTARPAVGAPGRPFRGRSGERAPSDAANGCG